MNTLETKIENLGKGIENIKKQTKNIIDLKNRGSGGKKISPQWMVSITEQLWQRKESVYSKSYK